MTRRYTLKRRAEAQDATRQRIAEAAAELHETLGPARTTISAVAERAGVQRLTVYRHFPDEAALFEACSSHWIGRHPPPDVARWAKIDDPAIRVNVALSELYAYYAGTARMWDRLYREVPDVAALADPMSRWFGYLDAGRDVIVSGFPRRGRRRLSVAAGHALDFTTWKSLTDRGASQRDAVAMMADWILTVSTR